MKWVDRSDEGPAARDSKATLEGAKLFNLADDIGETKDLASANPRKVKELEAKWSHWNAQLAEPLWGPPQRGKKNSKKRDRG